MLLLLFGGEEEIGGRLPGLISELGSKLSLSRGDTTGLALSGDVTTIALASYSEVRTLQ